MASRIALACGAYSEDGGKVWRWNSNNQVVPMDACKSHGIPCDSTAQQAARDAEVSSFFAAYRKMQPAVPSAKQQAEVRAAYGSGTTVVDVITGRKFRT